MPCWIKWSLFAHWRNGLKGTFDVGGYGFFLFALEGGMANPLVRVEMFANARGVSYLISHDCSTPCHGDARLA